MSSALEFGRYYRAPGPLQFYGRDRLLRVAEVAEQLAVGGWAVYKLCEDGDLAHVRINNSVRVRPADLAEFIAARTRTGQRTKHRPET